MYVLLSVGRRLQEVTDQYGGRHSSDGDRRWSYYVFACEEYGNVCHNRDHFISPYSRHRRRQDRRHLSFKLDEVRTCIIERNIEEMTWIIKEGKGVRGNILENLIWWGEGDAIPNHNLFSYISFFRIVLSVTLSLVNSCAHCSDVQRIQLLPR